MPLSKMTLNTMNLDKVASDNMTLDKNDIRGNDKPKRPNMT
jgi:hypothetical protein